MNDTRVEILIEAEKYRKNEVLNHQINIDNYRLAITEIQTHHADKPHMIEFMNRVRDLLSTSEQEQDKENVMLKVIRMQLEAAKSSRA